MEETWETVKIALKSPENHFFLPLASSCQRILSKFTHEMLAEEGEKNLGEEDKKNERNIKLIKSIK